ncbi:MAG: helix-turn-helix transcriptional regulator [Terracidiphilus sp.]
MVRRLNAWDKLQVSEDVLTLNEGTVYTSLLRLQQQGWIDPEWGTSENNRKARFYSINKRGRRQLAVETENWERISGVIGRVCVWRSRNSHDFLDSSTCVKRARSIRTEEGRFGIRR